MSVYQNFVFPGYLLAGKRMSTPKSKGKRTTDGREKDCRNGVHGTAGKKSKARDFSYQMSPQLLDPDLKRDPVVP